MVVANYLFDVLRQDLYVLDEAGTLREELIGVLAPANDEEIGSRADLDHLIAPD